VALLLLPLLPPLRKDTVANEKDNATSLFDTIGSCFGRDLID